MRKLGEKLSIRKQMIVIFASLILFLLLLFIVVNGMFAEEYYVANKRSDLVSVYKEMDSVLEDDLFQSNTELLKLNRMLEKNNVSVLLEDGSGTILYANVYNVEPLHKRLEQYLFHANSMAKKYQINRTREIISGAEYLELWAPLGNSNYLMMQIGRASCRERV